MRVKLKAIPLPEDGMRSMVSTGVDGPAFKGSANGSSYCCGGCDAVLIEGMFKKQFVDRNEKLISFGAEIIPFDVPPGKSMIAGTVDIPDMRITIFSFGPLVLICGHCGTANEMVAPNLILD